MGKSNVTKHMNTQKKIESKNKADIKSAPEPSTIPMIALTPSTAKFFNRPMNRKCSFQQKG